MLKRLRARMFGSPVMRRIQFYGRRASGQLDRRFFVTLVEGILIIVAIAALLITLLEKEWTLGSFGKSFYWGLTTVLGQGDASYITSPAGWIISWLLILFGVALFGTITGALIAIVIDFLLKEGQGMGASGYEGHVIVCGWNSTARDLIQELKTDDYKAKIVLIAALDKNPAGDGVYFVKGDPTEPADLERAGIAQASAALVFPTDDTNDSRHALDPDGHGHRVGRARRPDRGRGQQPTPRRPLPAGPRRRAPGLVAGRVTTARSLGALPRPYRAGRRHRFGRRRLRALSGRDPRRLPRAVGRPGQRASCGRSTGPPSCRSVAAASPTSIRRRTSGSRAGDDAVVVAESLGTLAPLVIRHEETDDVQGVPMALGGAKADGRTTSRFGRPAPVMSVAAEPIVDPKRKKKNGRS